MGDRHDQGTTGGLGYNSTDDPNSDSHGYAYTHQVILTTLSLIAFIAGTFGNTLVILAVLLSRKLRTATNAFVVNLSVADLLTALAIPCYAATLTLLTTDDVPVGINVLLIVVNAILYETVGCSVITLAWIGLNRLLLITRPLTTYRSVYSPRKIAMWLTLTWLLPLPFTLLLSIYRSNFAAVGVIIAVSVYPIPLIIIVVCYILIWRHLNRHTKRGVGSAEESGESSTNNLSMASQSAAAANKPPPLQSSAGAGTAVKTRPQLSRRQTEITKNMFYVVCAFLLCLTPYAVCLLLGNYLAYLYAVAILLFNGGINPLIYARKHRDFKTVFGCIFRRQWDKIPEPSEFLKAMRRNRCCRRSDLSA